MADRIYINTETYAQLVSRLNRLASELGDCASMLSRVDTSREAGGALRINLNGALRSTRDAMPDGKISTCVSSMRTVIRHLRDHTSDLADQVHLTSNHFETVEHELANLNYAVGANAVFSQNEGLGSGEFSTAAKAIPLGVNLVLGSVGAAVGSLEGLQDIWNEMGSRLHKHTSVSGEIGVSKTIFSGGVSTSSNKGVASASYAALSGEASASGSAHIFNKDGHLRPGANARIGASTTLFEANCSGEYELIDNVNVHGDGAITVGEASAEGNVNLGFDKDGDLNAKVDLSLEAIGAEATGTVGMDIVGLDVSATGSVNVGIGAHANAGYSDGVLTLDAGLSLGVGVSGAVEIDIGGFVENVKDTVAETLPVLRGSAERAWNFVTNYSLTA